MRRFLFLLFLSSQAFAQIDVGNNTTSDCDNTTFDTASGTANIYECKNVTITAPFSPIGLNPNFPLVIKATGTVSIDTLDLSGGDGAALVGGNPGLAGGGGGGSNFGVAENGYPAGQGGTFAGNSICGGAESSDGSGGGGGSLVDPGESGFAGVQSTGAATIGAPGVPGTPVTLDINNLIIAGAGGGSGETACNAGAGIGNPGGGGGGGGGIHILAAGNVTINTINASGGNGGDAPNVSGGGGGGSGGIIIIQTLAQINLTGSLLADEGNGGTNSSVSTTEGDGGAGAPGVIILEDLDGQVPGGTISPNPTIRPVGGTPTGSSRSSLSSDISCGTIGVAKDNRNETFQMLTGFTLALMMGAMIRILFRFPKKLLVKSARLR